jgi:hypothetical protein
MQQRSGLRVSGAALVFPVRAHGHPAAVATGYSLSPSHSPYPSQRLHGSELVAFGLGARWNGAAPF